MKKVISSESKKRIFVYALIFLLIGVIAAFAFRKDISTYDRLKNSWEANGNTLLLKKDFTFEQNLAELPKIKTGLWRYKSGEIILTADYEESIDSISCQVKNNEARINHYNKGQKVGNPKVIRYKVLHCTDQKLELQINNQNYTFRKASPLPTPDKKNLLAQKQNSRFSVNSLLRGLLGIIVILLIAVAFSSNRRAISLRTVLIGLTFQILLAISVLYIPPVELFFQFVGKLFVKVLDFTNEGTLFLFQSMSTGNLESALQNFAVQILPTIIFFSALTSVLFYLGVIQKIVKGLAWGMSRLMRLSGAESLSVAGNIFLGQTESPLVIKAYLSKMNKSEILLVMSGGMATLAGGVLAVYISFLGGDDPAARIMFAKHLLAASVMAAPGVVVISKILLPQTETIDSSLQVSQEKIGKNILDAISNGTGEGLRLAVNVAAMLLVFVSFIAMINYIFQKIGYWTNLNSWITEISGGQYHHFSLEVILGYVFAPLMWLIGVDAADITLVGQMLGEKLIMTEFIGYMSLAKYKAAAVFADPKSIIMATYMLCGFANFASIGIQIGGIGSLVPSKRILLSQLGMRALLAGTLASLLSATIVGMIIG
ncbi:MAG: Na+ dependent nucleoside transporter [Bacteroidia bacterium]|nr:MAG: Na+ dependent nucleoside transporter [Bacteroidia bacterium]